MKLIPKVYSYVVKWDHGFAPNPFWDYCTLACCKADIRSVAKKGDWVVGTGSVRNVGPNKLVYAMKVTEKLTFREYALDPRFKNKIPRRGLVEERGDNIYFEENGEMRQRYPSYHSKENEENDLKGEFVLISNYFLYLGRKAVEIPEQLRYIVKKGPKYKSNFDEKMVQDFINWLESLGISGKVAEPCKFEQELDFGACSQSGSIKCG